MSTAPGSNESVRSTPKKSIPFPAILSVCVPVAGNVTGEGTKTTVEFVCRCACGCVLGGAAGGPAGGCTAGGVAGAAPGTVGAGEPIAGTFGLLRSRGIVSEPV